MVCVEYVWSVCTFSLSVERERERDREMSGSLKSRVGERCSTFFLYRMFVKIDR